MNTSPLPTSFQPAASAIEQVLLNEWEKILAVDRLSVHDNFFERGGNALLALRAIFTINKLFGRHLTLSTVFDYPSVESFAGVLANKKQLKTRSLVLLKKGGNKIPLYMVTYLAGSVDRFCEFAYGLDADQPVYGLQTPRDLDYFHKRDFDMEEAGIGYIQNEASHYVSLVLKQNPDGPFALAGYSYGGFVAREMARQLQAKGKQVVLLAMFDTIIPGSKKSLPPVPEGTALKGLGALRYRQKLLHQEFRIKLYDNLFLLKSDGKKWRRKKWQSVKAFFIGRQTEKGKTQMSPKAKELTKNRKALALSAKKHCPLRFYDGEIVLFRARKRSSYYVNDLYLGWRPHCQSIKVYKVDGDHVFMFNPFYNKQLTKRLQRVLDECQKGNEPTRQPQPSRT